MADTERKYSAKETEAYRKKMLEDHVRPYVKKKFDKYPDLNSAVLYLSQFWSDEATDAVHYEFSYSLHQTPDITAYMAIRQERAEAAERHWKETGSYDEDREREDELLGWLMGGIDAANTLGLDPNKMEYDWDYIKSWDSNYEVIPHFAAFTSEGSHQEMAFHEAYVPFAIFRKDGDQITIEIIGKMHRPWLDGVAFEWEIEEATLAAKAEKKATKKPGFFSRLFGKSHNNG